MENFMYLVLFLAIAGVNCQTGTEIPPNTTTTTTTTTPPPPTPQPQTTQEPTKLTTEPAKNLSTPAITTVAPKPNATTTVIPVPIQPLPIDNGTKAVVQTYMVNDTKNGKVCILDQMAVKFVFSYNQTYEVNKTRMVGVEWNLPGSNMTTVSNKSMCGNSTQKLVLSFFEGWEFTVDFNKTAKGDKYEINATSLLYTASNERFTNVTTSVNITGTAMSKEVVFSWDTTTALKCQSDVSITGYSLPAGVKATLAHVMTDTVKVEAFRTTNSTDFTQSLTYCEADTRVSNIVPIAVGAALAGLVLIVLIAYLIGRSRNQRGYESV